MNQATLDRHAYILKPNPLESVDQMWARSAEFTRRCCYDERDNYLMIRKLGGRRCDVGAAVTVDCDKVVNRWTLEIFDLVRNGGASTASPIFESHGYATSPVDLIDAPAYDAGGVPAPTPPPAPTPTPGAISREEFYRRLGEVDAFYSAPEGLQRTGGMVIVREINGVMTLAADVEALGAWGFDLLHGATVEECKARIRAIPGGEWQQKHRGE